MKYLTSNPLATVIKAVAVVSLAVAGAGVSAQSDWPNKPSHFSLRFKTG